MLLSFKLVKIALISFLLSFLLTIIFTINVFAGSGLVSSIGGATFIQGATQFWVTSSTPIFTGVATAGSAITGTVGTETVAATTDASGNWSWTPTVPLSGDNSVTIASSSQSATFTLTIGDVPSSIASASGSTLPPAGTNLPTYLLLGAGLTLLLIGSVGLAKVKQT